MILGDSLTEGAFHSVATLSWPMMLDDEIGAAYAQRSYAVAGYKISDANLIKTKFSAVYDGSYTKNIAVVWLGTNDIDQGASAATALTNLQSLLLELKSEGFMTIVCTVIKRGDAPWDATKETHRTNLNSSILALSGTHADSKVDLAALSEFSDPNNGTYYHTDKIHLIDAGFAVVKDAIKPAVLAL
jgi:hypothetical protein